MRFILEVGNSEQLANVCGDFDSHLETIESILKVEIRNRGTEFEIKGTNASTASAVLNDLLEKSRGKLLEICDVDHSISCHYNESGKSEIVRIQTPEKHIHVRNNNQQSYIKCINKKDCTFGIGPAGTGKTYLAVAKAVESLMKREVLRIVLVRPAVEAGEKLGFLPGDLSDKIDPYLRPVYDALYEMIGYEEVEKMIQRNVIEVAPLAFMRGRTLNDSFIILDEAQNTTVEQMKMFLTRMGFGSKMVITGDITQIDLAKNQKSGLIHAMKILNNEDMVCFCEFGVEDIVRHKLVQRIVIAYDGER